MLTFAQAITQMENTPIGWNNPGALTGSLGFCTNGKVGSIVKFCTPEDGAAALQKQIDINTGRGLTLYEFFGGKPGVYPGYANTAAGNNPVGYADFVAANTGINPNIPLDLANTLSGPWDGGGIQDLYNYDPGSLDANMVTVGWGVAAVAALLIGAMIVKG